jgi:CheY-like chemotaxis protein
MLGELGLQVEVADGGWEALRAVGLAKQVGRPIELVLLDWKMPGMDGVECARLLQHGEAAPTVLMVSALSRDELQARLAARDVTVGAVLAKPVLHATLASACARALGGAVPEAAPTPRSAARPEQLERLQGLRVLLVEDNDINQELALELLGEAGIVVSVADNGEQALQMLAEAAFELVLMDCQMPVMDGYDATRALRRNPAWQHLPVIAMTANAMQGDRDKALAAGMNDHIPKPLDIDAMFETLLRWAPSGGVRS